MRGPISPMGIAGSFTGGFIAQDAPLRTSVSNVGSRTPLPSAHNQSQHPVKGKRIMFQPVEALPTPVKVERLAFYLEDYEAHLYHELRAILCQNQTKWEMKNFDPPLKFACK